MNAAITILDHLQFDCPTTHQKEALLQMSGFVNENNTDDFFILCGSAGTGKTSIITALIGYLNANAHHYKIVAPTGRAARILGRKSQTLNSTIHSLIYHVNSNPDTGEVFFELKENQIKDYTIFIVDEASMISAIVSKESNNLINTKNALLDDLIKYVKDGNTANKIILLGDRNQLPPINEVESKALSPQYLNVKFNLKGTSYLLTEVKRQKDGCAILKTATEIKNGIDANSKNIFIKGFEKNTLNSATHNYVNDFKNKGFENVVAIGATHNMNKMFNKIIREKLFGLKVKIIKNDDLLIITSSWKRNSFHLYSGDHVIVKDVNINDIEEVGGLHFVPIQLSSKSFDNQESIIEDYLLLESVLTPEGLKVEDENRLRHERFTKNKIYRSTGNSCDDRYVGAIRATYGHSITCYKAQGGEWESVYLNSYFMPTLKYQYTAVTRAKSNLILF